ncbi:McrBC 5-methylcytosine restriction system component [anaerobic digester metagenome]
MKRAVRSLTRSHSATLFEYERYPYHIESRDHVKADGSLIHLTEETLQELETLNQSKRFLEIDRTVIRPLNYIGVVKAGGITLQIFPKLFRGDAYLRHKDIIARNVLKVLTIAEDLSIQEIDAADLATEDLDFFEIFVHLFAKNLIPLVKCSQARQYVTRQEQLRYIRERVETRHYTNPAKLHIIPCVYHEFSMDTPLNRTLKYTCYLMSRMVRSNENSRLLKSIVNLLDAVTLTPVSLTEVDRIQFNRLNVKFEPFIRICRIFLSHSTLTLQASDVETFSLLIPMESLFEEFIARVLMEEPRFFFGQPVSIMVQKSEGYLAEDVRGRGIFRLRPDIVVESGTGLTVIDTKYKVLESEDRKLGVSQADMYQMYAYVTKTGAESAMLLYPDTMQEIRGTFLFDAIPEGGLVPEKVPLYIESISLAYDLTSKEGMNRFRADLAQKMKSLIGSRGLTESSSVKAKIGA